MGAPPDPDLTSGRQQGDPRSLEANGEMDGAAESGSPRLSHSENSSLKSRDDSESAAHGNTQSHPRSLQTCRNLFSTSRWKWILCISAVCLVSGTVTAVGYWRRRSGQEGVSRPPCVTSASQPWIQNGTWEYLFSKTEATWDESWKTCSCYGAALVPLDTSEERVFIEVAKLLEETWMDLRRESPGEPWRYSNGTAFEDRFNIENPNGLCAYWNVNHISSTTCDNTRYYVCRRAPPKPE